MRGDLLLARARPLQTFGNVAKTVPPEKIDGLRDEALARLRALRAAPGARTACRATCCSCTPSRSTRWWSTRAARASMCSPTPQGRPQLIADYYVTLGKNGIEKAREGDQKTPLGVYHVTAQPAAQEADRLLRRGRLPDQLSERVGPAPGPQRPRHLAARRAVATSTAGRRARATAASCSSNPDLESVGQHVQVGLTPVIIADEIEWATPPRSRPSARRSPRALEQWRADWESRDTDRYLAHYSSRFASPGQDLAAWARAQAQGERRQDWIKVGVSRVAMFRYPRERDFVVVTFDQDYRSNSLSNVMRKRQYWVKEGARWKIIYEGAG